MEEYLAFLSNLVSAQTIYLRPCLAMIVSHFVPREFWFSILLPCIVDQVAVFNLNLSLAIRFSREVYNNRIILFPPSSNNHSRERCGHFGFR